jgi:hypothetical protein
MKHATEKFPKLVGYLAHPFHAKTLEERQNNIAGVLSWIRFLVDNTTWSIAAPWLPYVMTLEESTYRDRGIEDDLAALLRFDFVILTGGRISNGMEVERRHAIDTGIPVIDLTSLGEKPPEARYADNARAVIMLRAKNAIDRGPRRVWLPPIRRSDIESLRALRLSAGPHSAALPDAVDLLSKIIARAEVRP